MRSIALGAALWLVVSSPAAAALPSPEENLDCAVWASVMLDTVTEPDAKTGIGYTLSWFIGLYEGETGQPIDGALTAHAKAMTGEQFEAVEKGCLARMIAYGERLQAVGKEMQQQPK